MKTTVSVWGELYEIAIHQESDDVWVAMGQYKGEQIEARGPTESSAAALWREAARYRGA